MKPEAWGKEVAEIVRGFVERKLGELTPKIAELEARVGQLQARCLELEQRGATVYRGWRPAS